MCESVSPLILLIIISIFGPHFTRSYQHDDEVDVVEQISAWSEDLPGWPVPFLQRIEPDAPSFKNLSLERDPESGCTCRMAPGRWALCFGASCGRFPRALNFSASPLLRVKTTEIKVISRGDLSKLTSIKELEIEGNPSLDKLEPDCFHGLNSLTNLSVSFNSQLKYLEVGVFNGLHSLLELRLTKNGFQHVADVARAIIPSSLPNLLRLELSENPFRLINESELEPLTGSSVRELSLILCQLEYVNPNALKPLSNLRVLRLGENSLEPTVLEALIDSMSHIPLHRLDLDRSGFRRHPPKNLLQSIARTNVTELILANNQFERMAVDSFPPMPRLRYLDLRGVVSLNVEAGTFNDMQKLRVLLLGHNKLTRIEPGVLPPTLVTLDMSFNSADRLFPSYFYLGDGAFLNNTNLTSLNLSYNRLVSLSKGTFAGLDSLQFLSLKNCTLFRLGSKCFSPLKNLLFLNLQNNRFPPSELTEESLYGMVNLKILQLGGCGLESIIGSPFTSLPSLEYLDLRDNGLVTLDLNHLSPLTNLIGVDLSDNVLSPWHNKRPFASNEKLQIMFLATNKLSTLTSEMFHDFLGLSRLDLSGNPFVCDCNLLTAKKNFFELVMDTANDTLDANKTITGVISQIRLSSAFCFSPDVWRDISVADFLDSSNTCYSMHENQSPSRTTTTALYAVLIFPLLIIGMCTVLIYRYRWYFSYWFFLVRVRRWRLQHIGSTVEPAVTARSIESNAETNYRYDAFISYSSEDRVFVLNLVNELENKHPFLRLCVYERDFEIGTILSEAIVESVESSRRTVLIISDSFVRSQWCMWELRMAQHRVFYDEIGDKGVVSLVLIRLGSVTEELLTPMLRYLMRTRIYLQWDDDLRKQQLFWQRLRAALTPSKLQNDQRIKRSQFHVKY